MSAKRLPARLVSAVGLPATRYDLVLAFIPSVYVVALLAANLLSVTAHTALVAASAVGALALLDALFLNPPRGPASG